MYSSPLNVCEVSERGQASIIVCLAFHSSPLLPTSYLLVLFYHDDNC